LLPRLWQRGYQGTSLCAYLRQRRDLEPQQLWLHARSASKAIIRLALEAARAERAVMTSLAQAAASPLLGVSAVPVQQPVKVAVSKGPTMSSFAAAWRRRGVMQVPFPGC
jgi:hypothetical protein